MKISNLVLTSLLFSLVISSSIPLITQYKSFEYDVKSFNEKISIIKNLTIPLETKYYDDVTAKSSWYFMPENVDFHNITLTSVKLRKGFESVSSLGESGIRYDGFDTFEYSFKFNYTYKCIYSGKGEGEFTAFSGKTILTLQKHTNASSGLEALISSSFKTYGFSLTGDYSTDSELLNLANRALSTFKPIKELENDLVKSIVPLITEYDYSSFKFETRFPSSLIEVDTTTLAFPSTFKSKGLLYSYNGKVKGAQQVNITNTTWSYFDSTDGDNQVFISQQIFDDTFELLSKYYRFNFTVTDENIPKGSAYNLTAQSLSEAYPQVLKTYSPDEKLNLFMFMFNFKFSALSDSLTSQVKLATDVYSESTGKLILKVFSSVYFQFECNSSGEFILLSGSTSVDYSFVSSDYGRFIDAKLNSYISNGLEAYLSANPYTIFKTSLSKNDNVKVKYIEDKGVVLIINTDDKAAVKIAPKLKFLA